MFSVPVSHPVIVAAYLYFRETPQQTYHKGVCIILSPLTANASFTSFEYIFARNSTDFLNYYFYEINSSNLSLARKRRTISQPTESTASYTELCHRRQSWCLSSWTKYRTDHNLWFSAPTWAALHVTNTLFRRPRSCLEENKCNLASEGMNLDHSVVRIVAHGQVNFCLFEYSPSKPWR